MAFADQLKKPAVLLTGLALGLLVLYFAGRGSSASQSGGNAVSLQSQDIATRANVALSSQTTDFNKAALQYQAQIAASAAATHAADLNANTALTLHALDTIGNQGQLAAQQTLQETMINGSVKLNAQKDASTLQLAQLQEQSRLTLAPQQAALSIALANISSSEAQSLATINANTSTTLATINGANRLSLADASNNQKTTDDFFKTATAIAPIVASAFL